MQYVVHSRQTEAGEADGEVRKESLPKNQSSYESSNAILQPIEPGKTETKTNHRFPTDYTYHCHSQARTAMYLLSTPLIQLPPFDSGSRRLINALDELDRSHQVLQCPRMRDVVVNKQKLVFDSVYMTVMKIAFKFANPSV